MGLLCEKVNDMVILCCVIVWFSIDIRCVGSLLSEVIVSLTPFSDQFPEVVSDVFKFLIVENESVP